MTGKQILKMAAKINGGLKKELSVSRIKEAIQALNVSNQKMTRSKISEITGLCLSTVRRHCEAIHGTVSDTGNKKG